MIIIIGASQGVGRYLFNRYKEINVDVCGTYNSTDMDIVNDMYKVDICNINDVERLFSLLEKKLSNLTLINCAGISYNSYAHKCDIVKWQKVIEVNLIGTFNVIRVFLPFMREVNFGRIINFSSVVTKLPTPGISAYLASKSGLNGLTKALSIENASKGVTVNSINLGYSNIGMGLKELNQQIQNSIINKIPAGRFCQPEEIFNTVEFIINNEYLNGSIIDLNGALI
jgi:NAD(P)-dependent dehydrogenase (short-subunit alcohol dehydrogenase family)